MRFIALRLGRSASTISREVHRNGGRENYRAAKADESAWDREPVVPRDACSP
jgi:IS30 family transposase